MSIITISRGSYSRGKEVAEKLAQRLGYGCISRDILLEASGEFNIPEIKLVRALHDAPQVIERFNNGKKRFVSFIRSSLLQHVKKDNIVYHGLAGHYFLGNIPGILKVRINADINDRVAEEMKRENISHDRALYILKKDDEERRKWGLQLYGTDTWDSRLYDMVLNIGTITVEDAIDILINLVKKPAFQTTLESMEVINDLALASSVESALVKIAPMVHVSCSSGTVYIGRDQQSGSPENEITARIKAVAMGIDGVREVIFQFNPAQEQNHHVNPFHNIG
jgi:cytidylate kinase